MVKRLPFLLTGWMWFAITIVPVIGIIQVSTYSMADHYHYLPSIGLSIILAWGIPSLFTNKEIRRILLFPMCIIFLTVMSLMSWKQCGYWKDSIKLFNHGLQVTKDNTMVHYLLGNSFFTKGKITKAIYHFNRAILIAPDYIYAYANRGQAYAKLGQHQRAFEDFEKVISLNKNYAEGYFLRGNFFGKTAGQYQLAIEDLSEAIRLKPDYVDAYNNRGIVLNISGSYKEAIDDFSQAIRLKPDYANAWNNRVLPYINLGDLERACSDAKKACELGNCNALESTRVKGLCN
jgi:tetratricopeptide (TPR) repeat protein